MCVIGVVRKISPPPPFLPMGGKASSPLEGEEKKEKTLECPPVTTGVVTSSPLKGEAQGGREKSVFPPFGWF